MKIDPIRPTDDEARLLASTLLRTARSAALASQDAAHAPLASLVLIATRMDGTPLTLVSGLAAHSANLALNPRASLLVSRTGRGDPLAHPRLSLQVEATRLDRETAEAEEARRRLLARHPKSALYIDFPDFSIMALRVTGASLNGGFGKAYALDAADIVLDGESCAALAPMEQEILDHMNDMHASTVSLLATALLGGAPGPWRISGIDPWGCDLVNRDDALRLPFPEMATPQSVRRILIALAATAQAQAAAGPASSP